MAKIGKGEFSRVMAQRRGYTIRAANEAYEDVFKTLVELLNEHQELITIKGLGRFRVYQTEGKLVQDFQKGCQYRMPPTWKIDFTPTLALKEEIKGK